MKRYYWLLFWIFVAILILGSECSFSFNYNKERAKKTIGDKIVEIAKYAGRIRKAIF